MFRSSYPINLVSKKVDSFYTQMELLITKKFERKDTLNNKFE